MFELRDSGLWRLQTLRCRAAGIPDNQAEVIDACARAEPGEVPAGALTGRLDRMLALMSEDPDRWYDSNPTNSPATEDETTPTVELIYIGGLLGGSEGPPACNRADAKRVDAATDAAFE
jgi:hypothetical protein